MTYNKETERPMIFPYIVRSARSSDYQETNQVLIRQSGIIRVYESKDSVIYFWSDDSGRLDAILSLYRGKNNGNVSKLEVRPIVKDHVPEKLNSFLLEDLFEAGKPIMSVKQEDGSWKINL